MFFKHRNSSSEVGGSICESSGKKFLEIHGAVWCFVCFGEGNVLADAGFFSSVLILYDVV